MTTKLKTQEDVIERYWPDYLDYCMRTLCTQPLYNQQRPTHNGFWEWYITSGPMGVKHANRYYNVERVEYV